MTRMLTISLITLGDPARLTGGYLYHRRMAELAPRFAARIEFVSFPQHPFPLPLLSGGRVLRQSRRAGPDVTLLDSIAAAYIGPWLEIQRTARPLAAILHQPPGGIDHGLIRSVLQGRLDSLAYRHARRLLVASEALAATLESRGMSRASMTVVPPGRDVAGTGGAPVENMRRGRQAAFLCVGNWIDRKGILPLLEAFARLPQDAATLHVAGETAVDMKYSARVFARLRQPDLRGRVVVHGPVSRDGVAALYASADAFVLPSTKEPYGTVYGEAMAVGLPVIGWRAGNLPYLADHGVEGLLVETGDIAKLGEALQSLAYDERLRHDLGDAAAHRALSLPTWEESAALFFATLRQVAQEA